MNDLVPGVRKILVLRPSAVGDFVFALPALHALRATYPQAEMVYVGLPWHAEFLAGRPGPVDRVVLMPPYPGVGAKPDASIDHEAAEDFVARMRGEAFDIVVQLYGGGRYSNPFAKRLGGRLTIGMKAADAEPLDRWVAFEQMQNRRLHALEVAALVGANQFRLVPELTVIERDRKEAADILAGQADQPLVIIHPGATDARRHWPAERFAAVADALAEEGALIAVNGKGEESELVRRVIAAMHFPAIDLTGGLSLSGLCGLIERAALLVSNDTGPLHLALALGTPCVGIFWVCNLIEACPLRQGHHRAALSARINCPVCGAENISYRCPHDVSFLDFVTVEEVLRLARELFPGSREAVRRQGLAQRAPRPVAAPGPG